MMLTESSVPHEDRGLLRLICLPPFRIEDFSVDLAFDSRVFGFNLNLVKILLFQQDIYKQPFNIAIRINRMSW